MSRGERLTKRNDQVRKLFYALKEKNPKWRIDAVVDEVADRMFLSARTVDAIISFEGIYNDASPKKADTQLKLL